MVGLLCAQTAKAEKTAKAILTYEAGKADSTLTFVYDAKEYTIGGKYNNVTILNVWDPTEVKEDPIPAEYRAAYPDVEIADIPGWIQFSEERVGDLPWLDHFPYITLIPDVTTVVFENSFAEARPTSCTLWFYNCIKLKSIIGIENLNTSAVTSLWCTFEHCRNLTSLDVSGFDTENVTTMRCTFSDCPELTDINVSKFNTSKVTDMFGMFKLCSSLKSLDVSGFDTRNVTTMRSMFKSCTALTSLDVSKFNTSNVTNMTEMFCGCKALTSLDLSNFNTSKVNDMYCLFYDCTVLASLNLTNLNTMNVTRMNRMFLGCKGLKSLDLSYFNTSKVTDMDKMFAACRNLESITISDGWNTGAVTTSEEMFNHCNKLVGENGTTFDYSNKLDKTYAHADEGPSNPGYMTLIDDVHQVSISSAGMATMYYDQALDVHPDVETWYCRSINEESCIVLAFPVMNTIPANTGVFFIGNSGSYLFPKAVGEAANVPTIDKNILVGSMTDTPVGYKEVLTLGHDQNGKLGFWYFTGTTIPAGKAYIEKKDVSADEPRAAARSYTVVFNEEGENQTTGISNVAVEKRNDGKIYNLNGQQVKNPTKGLYIVNGKKVILK